MKENINEHDMTKKMMSIIRGGYTSKLLTENDGVTPNIEPNFVPNAAPNDNLIELTDDDVEYQEELKKLEDQIYAPVKIISYKIDPKAKNVTLEGVFDEGKLEPQINQNASSPVDTTPNLSQNMPPENNELNQEINKQFKGIYFKFDYKDDFKGPDINSSNTSAVTQITSRLPGYYMTWKDEWAKGDKLGKLIKEKLGN